MSQSASNHETNVRGIAILPGPYESPLQQQRDFDGRNVWDHANNAAMAMGLFAVLTEVDSAGIPVGYLLMEVSENRHGRNKAESGAMISMLQQFLTMLRG